LEKDQLTGQLNAALKKQEEIEQLKVLVTLSRKDLMAVTSERDELRSKVEQLERTIQLQTYQVGHEGS
jgi:hypothetical protein